MKPKITICKNGAIIKLHNRRIEIIQMDNFYYIEFIRFDKELIGECNADKRIVTPLKLSAESMNALVQAYGLLINKKEF